MLVSEEQRERVPLAEGEFIASPIGRRQAPVVEDEHVRAREAGEEHGVAAVRAAEGYKAMDERRAIKVLLRP